MSRLSRIALSLVVAGLATASIAIWARESRDIELAEAFAGELLRVDAGPIGRDELWQRSLLRLSRARAESLERATQALHRFAESDPLGQPRRGRGGVYAEIVQKHWSSALRKAESLVDEEPSFANRKLAAELAFLQGERKKAMELLKLAVEDGRGSSCDRAAVLVRLACLMANNDDRSAAEGFLSNAFVVMGQNPKPGEPSLGAALDLAIVLAREKGDVAQVEALAGRRIESLSASGQINEPEMVPPLNALAAVRCASGAFASALATAERAHTIVTREQLSSPTAAETLTHLGTARLHLNAPNEAERLLLSALSMYTPQQAETVGAVRTSAALAAAQLALGRVSEAVQHLERANKVQPGSANGLQDPEYADMLDLLGVCYAKLQRWSEAEGVAQKAFDLLQARDLIDKPEHCGAAAHLGMVLMATSRPHQAEAFLRRAGAVIAKVPDQVDSVLIATVHIAMAACLTDQGFHEDAEEELLRLLDQPGAADFENLADLEFQLGRVTVAAGKYEQAQSHFRAALEMERGKGGRADAVARALNGLGLAVQKLGESATALSHLREAWDLTVELQGRTSALATRFAADYAGALIENGDAQQSSEILNTTLAAQMAQRGADHLASCTTLINLAEASVQLGRFADAESYLQRTLHLHVHHRETTGERLPLEELVRSQLRAFYGAQGVPPAEITRKMDGVLAR